MKNLFTKFLIPTCFCLLLLTTSCNKDGLKGVEESENYALLNDYHTMIDSWQTTSLTDISTVSFSEFNVNIQTNDCVDIEGDDRPELLDYRAIMNDFSAELGFKDVLDLNDWFIAYGRVYYDLIREFDPEDKDAFINEVTARSAGSHATDCELNCYQVMARTSYDKTNTFGVSVGGKLPRICQGPDMYGRHSSIHNVFSFLKDSSDCEN